MIPSNTVPMAALFSLALLQNVAAHGFLLAPIDTREGLARGVADNIATNIDALRNPDFSETRCRGAAPGPVTSVDFTPGRTATVTMAMSKGAYHVGNCQLYLHPSGDVYGAGTLIAEEMNCVSKYAVGGAGSCPNGAPLGLVTGDMCVLPWTFTVPEAVGNVDCSRGCVLRWKWYGAHVSPPEPFENCADVSLDGNGVAGSQAEANGAVDSQAEAAAQAVANGAVNSQVVATANPQAVANAAENSQVVKKAAVAAQEETTTMGTQEDCDRYPVKVGDECVEGSGHVCLNINDIGVCNHGKIILLSACAAGTQCDWRNNRCDWPQGLSRRSLGRASYA
ncbi:MAG: hypothetical protein SGCHY_005182 [Lobulomycetales sp.]